MIKPYKNALPEMIERDRIINFYVELEHALKSFRTLRVAWVCCDLTTSFCG
jgi:hypothetical protein